MNGLDVQLSGGVQGAGSGGYSVPIFRMNQGVNAATANPNARVAPSGGIDLYKELVGNEALDPTSLLRDEFDNGVMELNNWLAELSMKGYDPTNVDYSDQNSMNLYREFENRKLQLKKQADDLVMSRKMKESMIPKGIIVDVEGDAKNVAEKSFETNYTTAFDGLSKNFSRSGYMAGDELDIALNVFADGLALIEQGYLSDREQVKDNPELLRRVDAEYKKALGAAVKPLLKTESEMAQKRLDLEIAKLNLRAQQVQQDNDSVFFIAQDKRDAPLTGRYAEQQQYDYAQASFPAVDVTTSEVVGIMDGKAVPIRANGIKADVMEILPVDVNGLPIVGNDEFKNSLDWSGKYDVFAVGLGTASRKKKVDGIKGAATEIGEEDVKVPVYLNAVTILGKSKNKNMQQGYMDMKKMADMQSQSSPSTMSSTPRKTQTNTPKGFDPNNPL